MNMIRSSLPANSKRNLVLELRFTQEIRALGKIYTQLGPVSEAIRFPRMLYAVESSGIY
jgi:hypothetical protein